MFYKVYVVLTTGNEQGQGGERDETMSDPVERTTDDYNVYLSHRDARIKRGEAHFDNFWKNIQIVAGGAMATSLAFLKDIKPELGTTGTQYLKLSWVLLTMSIVFSLFASFCSAHGVKCEVPDLDRQWNSNKNMNAPEHSWKTKTHRWFQGFFGLIAPLAVVCGLTAMAFVLYSVSLSPPTK